jgi:hypothetical protein
MVAFTINSPPASYVYVFSELVAARAKQHQHTQHGAQNQSSSPSSISPSGLASPSQSNGNTSFSFAQDGSNDMARRPLMRVQGLEGMGDIGVRPLGRAF